MSVRYSRRVWDQDSKEIFRSGTCQESIVYQAIMGMTRFASVIPMVVNDIFVMASTGRVASCDGTVHIWNGQTGKQISVFSESSSTSTRFVERDEDNMLHFNPLTSGMLSTLFHGNLYSAMDYLEFIDRLVVGTGNGTLR
ncbi:PREDICTED: uncharacterized protein LOC105957175 isoform X2 [Erythranthe guttata]|uniref:uncharacterized protein LOC105957175 isoform X2 n=1 Tax=Erythranthe guttata TaxID=4155 RepID=UPI00064DB770|nr:PREDICTED: uncharacterized protein LOC105957175 isoform X2 [Erythranthe guttata]|eukprot:XP_012836555.1 PREDICTED: uncharacterized protein LOC105957175 isoform X2 [Erythranthe guttata]